jgi:radical SAM protein with 4Fe4S-binding SPASM domain
MSDCSIPLEDFEVLTKRFDEHLKDSHKRLAYFGTIEMTPYCNLKCQHCYMTQSKQEGKVLTTSELRRIIDEIADEGCLWLLLTGGEALMRNDFIEIYTYAKKKGIYTCVFTNGTLITPEVAQCFHDLPPQLVEISIYGATKTTYEGVTQVPGSFERCLRGIELLVAQGINLKLKTILMTLNKHEYWEMKKLAKNYGLEFRMDPLITPALDGSRQPCNFRLSPEEIVQIDYEDDERREAFIRFNAKYANQHEFPDTIYTCGAGVGKFNINGFGGLQTCALTPEPAYDLRKGSFHEGWQNFITDVRDRKLSRSSSCRSCQYRNTCPICPGWSQLEYGTLEEQPVDFLCQVQRLRATRF